MFLNTSPTLMEEMLHRLNQGLLSTAIIVEQLWDKHSASLLEARRLEVELGEGGDYDQPYTWSMPPSGPHTLAWAKLGFYESVASLYRRWV